MDVNDSDPPTSHIIGLIVVVLVSIGLITPLLMPEVLPDIDDIRSSGDEPSADVQPQSLPTFPPGGVLAADSDDRESTYPPPDIDVRDEDRSGIVSTDSEPDDPIEADDFDSTDGPSIHVTIDRFPPSIGGSTMNSTIDRPGIDNTSEMIRSGPTFEGPPPHAEGPPGHVSNPSTEFDPPVEGPPSHAGGPPDHASNASTESGPPAHAERSGNGDN